MSRQEMSYQEMFPRRIRLSKAAVLIFGTALLAIPTQAQRGGGAGANGGRNAPIICVSDCPAPEGYSSGDDLKDFHRTMVVQATADQSAAFAKVAQSLQDSSDLLQAFRASLENAPAPSAMSDRATAINQAIEKARTGNQKFIASLSPAQDAGLKDTTKRLEKADSDLDKQIKAFDQIVHIAKPESDQIATFAASLDKALVSFQTEHQSLGKEMSILLPTGGPELTFTLPQVTSTITFAGQTVSVPAAGIVSRISSAASAPPATAAPAQSSPNLFRLRLTADLSDLQQNITAILRSQLNRDPRCGERITIQQATLSPLEPSSLVAANVFYERWVCSSGPGQSPTEVSDGDAEIEIKLTPTIDPKAGLGLESEITRVNARGSLRDVFRSGDLGVTLREQIAATVLAALLKTADLRTTLPPAAQPSATLQRAQFHEAGVEQLSLILEGQLQLSDAQIAQFATQLKQRQSAQQTPAP